MTRPQLMIWYEITSNREYQEKIAEQKAEWQRTSEMLAMMWNTQMGIKKKDHLKGKDFMPDFETEKISNDKLIKMAENKGLKVPKK
jgi:hypothetical protein